MTAPEARACPHSTLRAATNTCTACGAPWDAVVAARTGYWMPGDPVEYSADGPLTELRGVRGTIQTVVPQMQHADTAEVLFEEPHGLMIIQLGRLAHPALQSEENP